MSQCPRCGGKIDRVSRTLICKCGWTYSKATKEEESSEKTVITGMVLSFLLLAGTLFHLFQWGGHAFSSVFAGPQKKLNICMDLKKYDCVEENYNKLFKKTNDPEWLAKLGELKFKREDFNGAEQTYKLYFSKEGKSYKAAYYYAHSLAKTGNIEEAISYFDSILRSKPHVLMLTIMESYLQILVSNNRAEKAREILSWAGKADTSNETANQIQAWRKKFNI